jgi:hypothetical protein
MKKTIYIIIALMFAVIISKAQTGCQAGFTYNVSGLSVVFTDASTSSNPIISWMWNFGDSQTSTSQNPTHTYSTSGTYYVCLTMTDNHGCHSTSCQHVSVSVPNPCHASYTFTTDSAGMTFYFTNTSTGTTSTTTYTWTFGDSTTSNLENPTHTYTSSGHYLVCLFINDTVTGCHSHYCHQVFTALFHHHHPHHPHPHREYVSAESDDEFFSIYPNPVEDVLNIYIHNTSDESSMVLLTDVAGKVVYSQQLQLKKGDNNLSIPVSSMNVESGIYFVQLKNERQIITKKLLLKK